MRISQQRRFLGLGSRRGKAKETWADRNDIIIEDKRPEYDQYPMVTADELSGRRERPRRVKMLTRDFIEGEGL